MKILLVHPSAILLEEEKIGELKVVTDHTLSLGIGYLASMLQKHGYEVELFDHAVKNLPVDEFVKWIIGNNFDVIGFSVISLSLKTAVRISEEIKKQDPNAVIIFGGALPTFCADQIMRKYDCVDFCVRGEGEYILVDLIKCIESSKLPKDVNNVNYRENGSVKSTATGPPIQDLDAIPIPDRKSLFKHHKYHLGAKVTPIITSRGCVYSCSFCACASLYNRTIRYRSVKNVIEEILMLKEQGFKEFEIVDDCFMVRTKRAVEFCRELKRENLDIYWHMNSRANLGNLDLFRTLVASGCKTISIGFESGVQRILNQYSKGLKVETSITAMKKLKKARFETIFGAFILGAPTETLEEMKQTIKFAFKLDPTFFQFQLLTLLPGTQLYSQFAEKGWIDPSTAWEYSIIAADVCPEVVKKRVIEELIKQTYIKFVTSPKRLFREYLRSLTSKYRLEMALTMPKLMKTTD